MGPIPQERPRAYIENLVLQYPNATQEEAPGIIYAIAFAVIANLNNLFKALEFLMKVSNWREQTEPDESLCSIARTVLARHILPLINPAEQAQRKAAQLCLEFFSHRWHAIGLTGAPLENLRAFAEACYQVIEKQRHAGGTKKEDNAYDPRLVMRALAFSRHHQLLRARRNSEALIALMEILAEDASRPLFDGERLDRSRVQYYCMKAIDYGCRTNASPRSLEEKEMAITALAIMAVSVI